MVRSSIPEEVERLPLLCTLTDKQKSVVLGHARCRAYAPDQVILHTGDTADGLHIVLGGRVAGLVEDSHAREVVSEVLGPPDMFGAGGVLHEAPSVQTFRSDGGCKTVFVNRAILLEQLEQNAAAALLIARALARRLQTALDKAASLALDDVYARVMTTLDENARESAGHCVVDLGSPIIATMVGASREMVSRIIKDLISRGLVQRRGRNSFAIDRSRLHAWAARRRQGRRE